MPVPPEQLDDIAATVAAIYREAETALVRIIAGHLGGEMDWDMQAPAWADKKLAAVQALRRSAQAVIAGLQSDSSTAIREAAAQAYRAGWTSALAELPKSWFPESGLAEQAAPAVEELPGFAAVEAMAAAVHNDIGIPSRNILRNVLDAYRSVITAATARTVTGVQTRRQASQAAWRRFMDRGISGFVDRAGRRWQLSSYVEMAVRTVTQRAAVTGQTDRLDALGVDLVMVSDNVQECALCRPYEGRVLRLGAGPTGLITVPHELTDEPFQVDVVSTLAEAMVEGLFHPNCRHSVSAYLPGVSQLPEKSTADPEGNKARQEQRRLERAIRRHKVNEVGALDEPARKAARRKVLNAQAALRAHLEEHPNLKRLRYREQIGAGNIPPKGKNDPVSGGIGPDVQPTLDGTAAVVLPDQRRVRERAREEDQAPAPVVDIDADQLSIGDVRTPVQLADALAAGRLTPGGLDDDQLRQVDQVFAERAAQLGKPNQVSRTHQAVKDEIERRAPKPPLDVAALTYDELLAYLSEVGADTDPDELDAVLAVLDRHQAAQDAADAKREADRERRARAKEAREAAQWERFEEMLTAGYLEEDAVSEVFGRSVDRQRRDRAIAQLRALGYTGKGLDELARKSFRDHLYEQYLSAETATRGHLLTPAAQAAGIDPHSLFSGPEARARRHASDELKQWWDEVGRMTYDRWLDQLLGNRAGFQGTSGDGFLQ